VGTIAGAAVIGTVVVGSAVGAGNGKNIGTGSVVGEEVTTAPIVGLYDGCGVGLALGAGSGAGVGRYDGPGTGT
jgi:hypothetical protein